ncbi:hypothetical protein [Halococcus hamelinensis]|uniref:Uncharacterized protein n=1 Tax=Halococcus hamelinensis 100A6 TaxID=1132509 RepID=M0LVY0_9EURY|nr:hypothetical protein [Halococcus hamelinensis]EMA37742.1 hypothetical protein C447_12240 [Halococcus hamelinensis 100A6]
MNPEPVEHRGLTLPEKGGIGAAGLVAVLPVFALAGLGSVSSLSIAVLLTLAVLTAMGYLAAQP